MNMVLKIQKYVDMAECEQLAAKLSFQLCSWLMFNNCSVEVEVKVARLPVVCLGCEGDLTYRVIEVHLGVLQQ